MSTKTKIIAAVVAIGAILIAIFQFGLGGPGAERGVDTIQTESPVVVATNPAAMKEKKTVVVLPTQSIEITFNQPLEMCLRRGSLLNQKLIIRWSCRVIKKLSK